jgi:hypothetical protein
MRIGKSRCMARSNWPAWPGTSTATASAGILRIGLRALEKLKSQERERLHSRKLRSFAEVAFQ